jgi:glycosyltransferase involved in cell wall biosynthesis
VDASTSSPYVSVVVTAYRRRTFLRDAVASALDQTLPRSEFEVLVLKDFADPEIDAWLVAQGVRVITEDLPRVGQMLARGTRLARGDVVCFLDDDDRFHRDKLAGVAEAFRSDARLGLLRNGYEPIDASGRPVPAWNRYRPQPEQTLTIDTATDTTRFLPWISHFSGYANVSTMCLRRSVLAPWLDRLDEVTAAQDLFIPTVAALSGTRHRFEAARWNDFRVHPSTSHPTIGEGMEPLEVRDLTRSGATAAMLLPIVDRSPPHRLSYRMAASFRWETEVALYLLDPRARLTFGAWIGYLRAARWRGQRYMLREWAYCPLRALFPRTAARRYRARRSQDIRAASVGG